MNTGHALTAPSQFLAFVCFSKMCHCADVTWEASVAVGTLLSLTYVCSIMSLLNWADWSQTSCMYIALKKQKYVSLSFPHLLFCLFSINFLLQAAQLQVENWCKLWLLFPVTTMIQKAPLLLLLNQSAVDSQPFSCWVKQGRRYWEGKYGSLFSFWCIFHCFYRLFLMAGESC